MYWLQVRLSPDDRRALTSIRRAGDGSDVWMFDLARGIGSRFSFNEVGDLGAVWSLDGRQVAYSDAAGDVWINAADGASTPRKISAEPLGTALPQAFTPDGSAVAVFTNTGKAGTDIVLLPLKGDGKPQPLLASPANEAGFEFSPDGRWMSYASDESGRSEFFVTAFPGPAGKWQVSTGGARVGGWLGEGKEFWYLDNEGKAFAVPILTSGGGVEIGSKRPLFSGQALPVDSGDFTHDGKRFLGTARRPSSTGPVLTLVTQWASELGER
jgi:Tol biopolymer transport system component